MRPGVELSNTEFPDDELRHEQEFIDGLYARVDALRGDAEVSVTEALAQGNTPSRPGWSGTSWSPSAPGCSPRSTRWTAPSASAGST